MQYYWNTMSLTLVMLLCLCIIFPSLTSCDDLGGEKFNQSDEDIEQPVSLLQTLARYSTCSLDDVYLSKFPILRDGVVHEIDVAKEIWNNRSIRFGVKLLGIERHETIEEKVANDPETAKEWIVFQWLLGKGKKPITCKKFIGVLHEIGHSELALEMNTTCMNLDMMDALSQPNIVKDYSHMLSRRYKKDPVIDGTQWLQKKLLERGKSVNFVELKLNERGRTIRLSDLTNKLRSGIKVLLVGRPGADKTTIIHYLSKMLINDTEQFHLVLKVSLGLSGKIDSLNSLLKVSAYPNKSFHSNNIDIITEYIEATLGEGVCFLLDGFDEYSYNSSDYVSSLIQHNALSKSVVIVTSRPSAIGVTSIEVSFTRSIEIIGFGEISIKRYLDQLELSRAENETIYHYLNHNPNIRQLCYLPLHLSMLVYVTVSNHSLSLIDTETELYYDFFTFTITQYKQRHYQTLESFTKCFGRIEKETGDHMHGCLVFQKLCEVAFKGVISKQLTFNSSSFNELPDSIDVTAMLEGLSLFHVETVDGRYGNDIKINVYHYSHPSFQEFLAAFYLATLPRDIDDLLTNKRYSTRNPMYNTYKFFLGLIGRKSIPNYDTETVHQVFLSIARKVLISYRLTYHNHVELKILKLAYEAGQSAVDLFADRHLFVFQPLPVDCWYIGYALTRSSWNKVTIFAFRNQELSLCLSNITNYLNSRYKERVNVTNLKFMTIANEKYWSLTSYRAFSSSTVCFNPYGEVVDNITTGEILNLLPAFQNDLTYLDLSSLFFLYQHHLVNIGIQLTSFRKLQSLALTVGSTVIEKGHLQIVLRYLVHLKHLKLKVEGIHCEIFDDIATFSDYWVKFNGLEQLQSLQLYIDWDDINAATLIGTLEPLTGLTQLTLHIIVCNGFTNGIHATELFRGVGHVSSSVPAMAVHFDLCSKNGLGNINAVELVAALGHLTMVKNLSVCVDFMHERNGNNPVKQLADRLNQLTNLQELNLTLKWVLRSYKSVETAKLLGEGLKHLVSLKLTLRTMSFVYPSQVLSTSDMILNDYQPYNFNIVLANPERYDKTSNTVILQNGLKQLKEIRQLDLSWNNIGDDDIIALVEALKCMKNLTILDLSYNQIENTGVQLLADLFYSGKYLNHLEILILRHNYISNRSIKIFSLKLEKLSKSHAVKVDFGFRVLEHLHKHEKSESPAETCDTNMWFYSLPYAVSSLVAVCVIVWYTFHLVKRFMLLWSLANILSSKGISESLAQGIFSTSSAWNLERLRNLGLDGTGIVIAIFDTSVDLTCPAFHQKHDLISTVDCLPQKSIVSTEHDSVCASVAAGLSYQITPTASVPYGVAPGAKLIIYRIAEGNNCYDEAIITALDDIRTKLDIGSQIDVVSISYDFSEDHKQVICEKIKALVEKGVVFVAAAGNSGDFEPHASIPARFDCVISVGALDKYGRRSLFNSRGHIDVYAPGEDIPSPSSPSGTFWGTSFATPAVAGLVSLLKQCSNQIGPPAREHIHRVEILRSIFNKNMTVRSDDGQVDILYPRGFLLRVLDNPNLLNEIVQEHLDSEQMEY